MPKMTAREKLADLEARQRKLNDEIEIARQAVRARYADALGGLAIERLTERECRDLLEHAIRAGAPAAISALKALPSTG